MAGEVTARSVILQSRLTSTDVLIADDLPGASGMACFELSADSTFARSWRTEWIDAVPEHDYIVKTVVCGLKPGTRYYYRPHFGANPQQTEIGPSGTFRTLDESDTVCPISFVVVTGMNYAFFYEGNRHDPARAYRGTDRHLGYPALETILTMRPDFFIGTGDNVYYDHHADESAVTRYAMCRKWHEQFAQKRFRRLLLSVPTYWEKDDHDYRYNDADTTGFRPPSHDLGIEVFREQVPVVPPGDDNAVTYRTHRLNALVQLWFVEGRDYRSPNDMPDGPGKTLWGVKQGEWLRETLLASDAPFKILVSPTPMVGPDDAYKIDNHVNHDGFRSEGDMFFAWLADNGFRDEGFFIICGDRHWQYHSIHPSGFNEFSTGALVDANSRLGRKPGDPESTDPDATIKQPFISPEASGGFLRVDMQPVEDTSARADFIFFDERGTELYRATSEVSRSGAN